ncbi:dihydropteroate synthase [Dysgonomonas macrotermitis]|uniref:dihydropteroate synthase n=1 Tax=Dysgonomonas macrotermitis TaxID=1346286 RepID=A0A1M5G7T6_9BACT|nr:dihydropteroate synthase [Dysgonomonas macrotermitis]SHF99890.1 dihydropteroate synthase [Dysgonomonas macrotermitis]
MSYTINIKGELLDLSRSVVMGILNITPDSFYADSRKPDITGALKRVEQCIAEGATIIDIGAQSTRPASDFLSAEDEIQRLAPVLEAINKEFPQAVLSIDTFHAGVARFCVQDHSVAIVNDISGGELDNKMFETVAELNVPYILMHMRGTPQTMQQNTSYGNLLEDIVLYLTKKVRELHLLGVNDIIIDPGFGFSKNVGQNYELMSSLSFFKNFELPLLVGISRKSMITKLLDITADEALNASTVLNTYALLNGADILRVHDVKEAVQAIELVEQLQGHTRSKTKE